MATGSNYFSHDYNARTDDAIKAIIRKFGMEGYGVWWAIIEDLYSNANALRLDCEGIAFDLRVHCDVVTSIIYDYGLFQINGSTFSSKSVQKRLDKRNEKSVKAAKSAKFRWGNANALQTESDSNAIKEKESKGNKKERKENNEEINSLFEKFWGLYDKKQDREKCYKIFSKLAKTEIEKIFEKLPLYISSTPDKQYRKNPQTWLNGKCWNDEVYNAPTESEKQKPVTIQKEMVW